MDIKESLKDLMDSNKGVFMVNVLGLVYNPKTKQILIGRRENDPYFKELTWCFPGGRPAYANDLELYLKEKIKVMTGVDIEVKKNVFAKTYPEKREFLSVYYFCELSGGQEKSGDKFVEVKWVKPSEVKEYFTTSLHPNLFDYLKTLD